ncbi:MAG: hypothetical protein KJ017_11740 [Alphaproteobacteria bacterium]|nr:hypothetical protein [Alphaproteobacteria bacterium]
MGSELLKLWLIVCLSLVFIVLSIRYEERKKKKFLEKLFEGRTSLSKEEFYRAFYSETDVPKDLVIKVIQFLEDYLDCDFSRILPSDSFSSNLQFFLHEDEWAGVEIERSLEMDFSIQISEDEANNAHTIDDLIRLVWTKVQAA